MHTKNFFCKMLEVKCMRWQISPYLLTSQQGLVKQGRVPHSDYILPPTLLISVANPGSRQGCFFTVVPTFLPQQIKMCWVVPCFNTVATHRTECWPRRWGIHLTEYEERELTTVFLSYPYFREGTRASPVKLLLMIFM